MSIQTYTIQKGDTLTKIAAEHYGLKGNEAYQKALEIAKDNNIANPNLIYAGASLNLLFEDEPKSDNVQQPQQNIPQEQPVVEHENKNPEADVVNTYQKLLDMQKQYFQYQDAKEEYADAPKDFNPETDTKIRFADAKIFKTDDIQSKVKAYAAAALELAEQDIQANDTEDENGKKDGAISYEEFEKSEMTFFEASQGAAMRLRAEDQFVMEYLTEHGVLPDETLVKEAGEQAYDSILTQYKASLGEMFQAFDVDGSGLLEKTEIATGYVMMDASNTVTENAIKLIGSDDEGKDVVSMAFDGEIDFDDTAIYVKNSDEAKEYQKLFGTDYTPVYYTAERVKEIHNNMFAA